MDVRLIVTLKDLPQLLAGFDHLTSALGRIEGAMMAAVDDLKAAVDAFTAEVATDLAALSAANTAAMERIAAALAAANAANDPQLVAATEEIQKATADVKAGLQTAVDALNHDVPAPPAPSTP